jgi:hypothetical protein
VNSRFQAIEAMGVDPKVCCMRTFNTAYIEMLTHANTTAANDCASGFYWYHVGVGPFARAQASSLEGISIPVVMVNWDVGQQLRTAVLAAQDFIMHTDTEMSYLPVNFTFAGQYLPQPCSNHCSVVDVLALLHAW